MSSSGPDTDTPRGSFWEAVHGRRPPPPATTTLGYDLHSADPVAGEVVASFEATADFTNTVGNVQGGFLAAMLDSTLGSALMCTLGPDEFAPTLELKVSFLRPAPVGRLWGRGRVLHRGSSIAFVEGELTDDDRQVLATASATAKINHRRD
ncbi:PaaI family thioesterase [Marmoricola endophyticus]|nr:PaaI family thioesterase [Marmoricola endophyticus]